eukprot:10195506-Karenia_brevis.AAC.1
MNVSRKGSGLKLLSGMTGPRAQPKSTSMIEIRKGNDHNLHLGMTGPRAPLILIVVPINIFTYL